MVPKRLVYTNSHHVFACSKGGEEESPPQAKILRFGDPFIGVCKAKLSRRRRNFVGSVAKFVDFLQCIFV